MKKVLLIAPSFFDYYKHMMREISALGYEVDYAEDKPSSNTLFRAVARVNINLVKSLVKPYFTNILDKAKEKQYDIVLLVAGMSFAFDKEMIFALREVLPQAEFVLYQWDSDENLKYTLEIRSCFNRSYSFDREDAKCKKELNFLPLFYCEEYEKVANISKHGHEYDCVYIGTAHPHKFDLVNQMAQQLKSVYPKQLVYHYMPSVLKFWYQKLLTPEFRHTKKSDFHYKKFSSQALLESITTTDCILDSPQAHQIGLTIRTIECLGAKRKLITTNQDIVNYDFYHPQNIYVYDGQFDFSAPFFTEPYLEPEKYVYEKYSLRNWLRVLLQPEEINQEEQRV